MDRSPRRRQKDGIAFKTKFKSKPPIDVSSNRFQCPLCPKNFSRVENLTRHQANHDDVGKFVCSICNKPFTRSDLLNRHRKIHGSSKNPVNQTSRGGNRAKSQEQQQLSFSDHSSTIDINSQAILSQPFSQLKVLPEQDSSSLGTYHPLASNVFLGLRNEPKSSCKEFNNSSLQQAIIPKENSYLTPISLNNQFMWEGFVPFQKREDDLIGNNNTDISWTLDFVSPEISPDYSNLGHNVIDFTRLPSQEQKNDEDTTDWPDKMCEDAPSILESNHFLQFQTYPTMWNHLLGEARAIGCLVAVILPVQSFTPALRDLLIATLNNDSLGTNSHLREITDAMFPPVEVLEMFLCLYVQYVHPRFPVLHLPTFDIQKTAPILILTMMLLGSCHSQSDRGRFSQMFYEPLKKHILRLQEIDMDYMKSLDKMLAYFLLCVAGTWIGCKHAFQFAEGARGILVTACRRNQLLDCRPIVQEYTRLSPQIQNIENRWRVWIRSEKKIRLGLCIYMLDCQYTALFNNQPFVNKAETTLLVYPCLEEYWEAQTADEWMLLAGNIEEKPITYHLSALNACLLRRWAHPPPPVVEVGDFGKIVLMYAIHTHIHEFCQALTMLNPTGLRGTPGNFAYNLGNDLRTRRRWLRDALISFTELYQTPFTSTAAILLNHLGYIYLEISLSDIHLASGRSTQKIDKDFACESLKQWANSDISDNTMIRVYTMLDICYLSISSGNALLCSYEITISLFTGGIICLNYAKLRVGAHKSQYYEQVRRASAALGKMSCWPMCDTLKRILKSLECTEI